MARPIPDAGRQHREHMRNGARLVFATASAAARRTLRTHPRSRDDTGVPGTAALTGPRSDDGYEAARL